MTNLLNLDTQAVLQCEMAICEAIINNVDYTVIGIVYGRICVRIDGIWTER